MIHMYVGKETTARSKTACKVNLQDLPRQDGSIAYKNRHLVECECCKKVIAKIENMLGEK